MTSPDLPAELQAALAGRLEGLSRSETARRAALISRTYRDGGTSRAIRTDLDALAYALARMPATYAAISASLNALCAVRTDLAPASLLDIGAGPGTASWAAAASFASLRSFALIDANEALRALALALARGSPRFDSLDYRKGEAAALLAATEPADLVIASYLIGELAEHERTAFASLAWSKARDTLLIVEPGTPAGYRRILAVRAQLIAAGAHVAAPCPHDRPCPLAAPDWCHFAQRLARSRAHKQVKGADAPFEDEKFIYLALTRRPPPHAPPARVLTRPVLGKVGVTAKLCVRDGTARMASVPRRDRSCFAAARRWDWGDGVDAEA